MEYVYPAVFHANNDESYTITYPDLPGCISEGKTLGNAMYMAQSALTQWIEYHTDKNIELPQASKISDIKYNINEFVNLIRAEVKDNVAIKRTISLPKWMDEKAKKSNLSLSKVLQDALYEEFA